MRAVASDGNHCCLGSPSAICGCLRSSAGSILPLRVPPLHFAGARSPHLRCGAYPPLRDPRAHPWRGPPAPYRAPAALARPSK
ncbi:hypothetical protein FNV43_RR15056 [Rhamnella rubrinervis]|uniref:Uncharacterized protein n=1 Tax=Rhamnella rubrinervis TaxID=2594499 RepID=A0A8K0GY90_9ROSA|nr:hypothetical protein FNV43_RR15056 [Rhamnella rubrinervis]